MAEPFMGQILAVGFNFAPTGWLLCQGQMLPIAQYSALFSLLGTYYGGNGQTTFGLPDLRGRVAVGQGQGPGTSNYVMGQASGTENTTLTVANMPSHTHVATFTPSGGGGTPTVTVQVQGSSDPGTVATAAGNYIAGVTSVIGSGHPPTSPLYAPAGTLGNLAGVSATISGVGGGGGTVANALTGLGQPFSTLQPYLTVNYIIAYQGMFPSRS